MKTYVSRAAALRYATPPPGTHWRRGGAVAMGSGGYGCFFWWRTDARDTDAAIVGKGGVVLVRGLEEVTKWV